MNNILRDRDSALAAGADLKSINAADLADRGYSLKSWELENIAEELSIVAFDEETDRVVRRIGLEGVE